MSLEDTRRLEKELTAAALAYLNHCDGPGRGWFTVSVGRRGKRRSLRVRGGAPPVAASAGLAAPSPEQALLDYLIRHFLSPLEREVIRALEEGPRTTPSIAKILEDSEESHGGSTLKTILAEMRQRGLLANGKSGYQLVNGLLREVLQRLGEVGLPSDRSRTESD